jgi:mono/diheme cytochrome c family protein
VPASLTVRHQFLPVAVLLLAALLVAGCGSSAAKLNDSTEPLDLDKARQSFQANCRSCHSLADANAAGVFGPDLDQLQPDARRVREQIDSGGGGMPAHLIDGSDADLVARYVAEVAGQGGAEGADSTGARGQTKPSDEGAATG